MKKIIKENKIWLLWVLVSAITPMLWIIQKTVIDSRLSFIVGLLLLLGIPVIIGFSYWYFLRVVAPRLNLNLWLLVALVSVLSGSYMHGVILREYYFSLNILHTIFDIRDVVNFGFSELMTLPWFKLTFYLVMVSFSAYILPSLLLGKYSRHPWYHFLFAGTVGTVVVMFIEIFYSVYSLHSNFYNVLLLEPLNGKMFVTYIKVFAWVGSLGAIWAIVSTFVFYLVSRKIKLKAFKNHLFKLFILFIFLIFPIVVDYIFKPHSFTKTVNSLTKIVHDVKKDFSSAPQLDISTGELILKEVKSSVPSLESYYPQGDFSFEQSSFVVFDKDNSLAILDTATAKIIKKLTEPLKRRTHPKMLWSPDRAYFLVLTDEERVKIKNSHYTRALSRVRLYSLPDYELINDYTYREDDGCLLSYSSEKFENDSQSFWSICNKYKPYMAIEIAVPSLEVKRYRLDNNSSTRHLYRTPKGVIAINRANDDNSINLFNLSKNQTISLIEGLKDRTLGGNLLMQDARFNSEQDKILVDFCGDESQVSNPNAKDKSLLGKSRFCREITFDTKGNVLTHRDYIKSMTMTNNSSLKLKNIEIFATYTDTNNQGELVVKDKKGKILQTIKTVRQRLLKVSDDKKWLLTYLVEEHRYRRYRIFSQSLELRD